MKVNFTTDLNSDTGTLVFLCIKNNPLDKYLNSLNKKIKGYIDKAIKVSSMEYNNHSFTDIVVPQGSKANRIILFGVDQDKISNEYEWGKLGSSITSVLNNKKIKEIKLIVPNLKKNKIEHV